MAHHEVVHFEAKLKSKFFGITVASFAIVIGSIGNLLTILAYLANKKLQTSFNTLVVNLSSVDFITASLMLPFNLAGYVQMQWPFGNDSFTARLQAFSYFSCGYSSVVFLVVITTNRFIGVFWPGRYDALFNSIRMKFVLVFCWTFAPLLLLPTLVGTSEDCKATNYALTGFHSVQFLCTFICLPEEWKAYSQILRVLFQFLPLGIMISLYAAIFVKLQNKAKQLTRTMSKGLRSSSDASTATISTSASGKSILLRQKSLDSNLGRKCITLTKRKASMAELRRTKNNKRMLIISVVICVAFMVTFLPSVIVNLIPNNRSFDVRVHMTASVVSWFNSSINPIIYVILNPRFRREYIRLIKLAFGKTGSRFFHHSTSVSVKQNVEKDEGKKSRSNSTFSNAQLKLAAPKQESQETLDTLDRVNESM